LHPLAQPFLNQCHVNAWLKASGGLEEISHHFDLFTNTLFCRFLLLEVFSNLAFVGVLWEQGCGDGGSAVFAFFWRIVFGEVGDDFFFSIGIIEPVETLVFLHPVDYGLPGAAGAALSKELFWRMALNAVGDDKFPVLVLEESSSRVDWNFFGKDHIPEGSDEEEEDGEKGAWSLWRNAYSIEVESMMHFRRLGQRCGDRRC
jgi:hypothetical protein